MLTSLGSTIKMFFQILLFQDRIRANKKAIRAIAVLKKTPQCYLLLYFKKPGKGIIMENPELI